MLKPLLARGKLRLIGATTLDEYRKYIEKGAALERRFQPVFVGEPSVEDTISILRGLKERYETHHGVRITDAAIIAAATLSARYITDRFLPDKAIDLIDEAAARLRMEITSDPAELDEIKRRIMQLEIEREALKRRPILLARPACRNWRRSWRTSKSAGALEAQLLQEQKLYKKITQLKSGSTRPGWRSSTPSAARIGSGLRGFNMKSWPGWRSSSARRMSRSKTGRAACCSNKKSTKMWPGRP